MHLGHGRACDFVFYVAVKSVSVNGDGRDELSELTSDLVMV